jgi:hypothetical protein
MQVTCENPYKKQEKKIIEYNIYKNLQQINICCLQTIELHIRKNAMISCSTCKGIIKSFMDESTYLKYLQFCQSRKRKTVTSKIKEYWIVIFKNYHAVK